MDEGRRRKRWTALTERMGSLFSADTGADHTEALVESDRLARAFASLGHGQRIALVLRYYVDLSIADIAFAVDAPESTVRSRLRHALGAMRAALDAQERTMPVRATTDD
ncbi:MAG: hypothetical protein H0T04_07000 [Chloroflexi bacterium]|nr:hypothetical protein [Chloroflexota bacterium]